MKKKLFLHIGFHKTGTSSLQEFLNDNRKNLLKQGICYLEPFDTRFPSNVDLSWAMNSNPQHWFDFENGKATEIISFYNKQLKENVCDTAVLSSEDFCMLGEQYQSIKNLKTLLNNYDVKVVAYIRDPIDFLTSIYCHAIRENAYDGDLKSYYINEFKVAYANFHERLKLWTKVFGIDNMIVKKYSSIDFYKNNLIQDFFYTMGLSIKNPVKKTYKSNMGVHVWLIRSYMEIGQSEISIDEKSKLQQYLLKIGEKLPKVDRVTFLLAEDDLNLINMAYDEIKQKIQNDYKIDL